MKAYTAVQVTVPNGSAANLWALCQAVDSTFPGECQVLSLQAAGDNVATILVGDSNISTSRYGYSLANGDSRSYSGDQNNVHVGLLYVWGTGASLELNVEAMW